MPHKIPIFNFLQTLICLIKMIEASQFSIIANLLIKLLKLLLKEPIKCSEKKPIFTSMKNSDLHNKTFLKALQFVNKFFIIIKIYDIF
jgi:hypothetical protein